MTIVGWEQTERAPLILKAHSPSLVLKKLACFHLQGNSGATRTVLNIYSKLLHKSQVRGSSFQNHPKPLGTSKIYHIKEMRNQ